MLNGRFTLMQELGGGGMGVVFKARDAHGDEAQDRDPYVAVKILSEEFKRHPDSFTALQREVKRSRNLQHENVITVYDTHRDGPHDYMSMEYLEGSPLDALLRGEFPEGMTLEKALPLIRGIGAALQFGHANGIIHSDLKPGNVFICNDERVKVLDFGIARPMRMAGKNTEETLFDPGKRLGALTPAYAALEMWNREPPDPRDDIYALAVITYELLSGRHPYGRKSAPVALKENLSPQRLRALNRDQWNALCRGLALKREDRVATVEEFLAPLRPIGFMRRYRKSLMVALIVLLGAAVAVGLPYYNEYKVVKGSEAYRPVIPRPRTDLTPEEMQSIEDSLYLADDDLKQVNVGMRPPEFSYRLSEGTNNVNQALDSVLKIDPGNRKAWAMKQRVADLYADKARQLIAAKDVPAATYLVSAGRKIFMTTKLYRVWLRVCERQPGGCRPDPMP